MSELRCHAEDYLRLRRSLGFKLRLHGPLLAQFMDYLEAADATTLTTDLAVSFAQLPQGVKHGTRLRPVHAGDRPGDRDPAP
jgi:hypothetical protein